jgi:hypothetical protein
VTVTLVCACGKKLKAPGAVPGRVGRCPACGGELRVPEAPAARPAAEPGGYALVPEAEPVAIERPAAPRSRRRPRPQVDDPVGEDRGLVRPPREVEMSAWESLAYPLWGAPGIAVLVTMPPVLWLTSVLSIGLVPNYVLGQSEVTAMGALIFIAPMMLFLVLTLGYVGVFFERVLIDAAAGNVHHPRMPGWGLMAMVRSGARLILCLAFGFALPACVAVYYWLHCGDLDWADRVILLAILTPGAVYALIALASVILHDDVWAANPITVLSAVARLGGRALPLAFGLSVPMALTSAAVPALFVLGEKVSGLITLFAIYVFWLVVVYEGMVLARVLGNFCRREDRRLGWFVDRPQWGR